jgi:PAS domain S-box-containing protein
LCDEHGNPTDIRYLDINPKMEQWIGRPRHEIVGHTVRAVLPGVEEHWVSGLSSVALNGQPVRARLYNHNTQRHYEMYAFSPQPGQAAALFLDVTVEVRIHEDLQQANDRLRQTLESVTDAYYAVDREWRFVEMNPVAERDVFARPAAELLGRVMWEEYPHLVGSEFDRQYRTAMTTGQPAHFEARSMLSDKWLEAHVYPREQRLEVYLRNITGRKRAEQAREEALAKTTELYETSRAIGFARTADEMLQVLLRTHVLRHCHRSVLSVFEHAWVREGDPPHMSEVLACWDAANNNVLTGQHRAAFAEQWARAGAPSAPVFIPDVATSTTLPPEVRDYLVRMKASTFAMLPLIAHGEWFGLLSFHFPEPYMIRLEDVRYIQGLVDQAAVAVYNTRLLEAEAAARREAERANELRLRFLAMISHELRTPLTSIKGFATTLLARDVTWDEASQQDFLATIDAEADKLTEMIDQLLDLSRLEAGSLRINPELHQVADILVAATAQLGMLAQRHRLSIDLPADLPPIRVDQQRIAQVLLNLVGNAAKYSPPGTPIALQIRSLDGLVQFDVIDQGQGISPEDRPFVFEAFRRGSDERSRRSKGAGLGLAICKGLVEAHGGRIWIQERPGPGTTISFILPAAQGF